MHLGSPQTSPILAGGYGPGNGTHQLCFPYAFALESDQNAIIVADWGNHRIVRWKKNELNGEVMIPVQDQPNPLNGPTDILIDREQDSLIICDRGHRRILRWSRRNNTSQEDILIDNIACWGIALDQQRNLYVSDTDNHAVKRYRLDTMEEGSIVAGGHGYGTGLHQLNQPTYLFVDRYQNIYVTDTGNHRVMKWNREATSGIMVARGFPRGLYVDAAETLYMADYGNHRLMRWPKGATTGSIISSIPAIEGDEAYEHITPWSIVGDDSGYLYVGDHTMHRVQRFSLSTSSDVDKKIASDQ